MTRFERVEQFVLGKFSVLILFALRRTPLDYPHNAVVIAVSAPSKEGVTA
ncbi:hypothetical protein ABZU78_12035 [Rhodococcus erythropolis]